MFLANFFELKVEKKQIQSCFDEVDKDKNGTLSFDELVKAYLFKV
jgi:Ca2+-binding EF-hand superfamily protein